MAKYKASDNSTFGWYSSPANKNSIDDYKRNGLFCESGLAYNSALNKATCTSATTMMFDDAETVYPYKCDPTDPAKDCSITFKIAPENEAYTKG